MKHYKLLSLFVVLSFLLVSCATPTPERIVETVVVQKEGKTIVQTVEVVKTVEVEKTVEIIKKVNADCAIDGPTEPVEVTYLGWPGFEADTYTKWLEQCGSLDNIKVNVRLMDNASAIEQMSLAFASGGDSPYAIVHQSNSSIQRNAWKGWLLPLNDLIDKYREKYNLDDISQSQWDAATFNGNIVGIPMGSNTIMLMYRSDLFDKYGLKVPTTYDEIITACEALKKEPGIDVPFTIDLSAGWAWTIAFFEAIRSEGGGFFVEGGNEPAFNSPEGVAALTKIKEVVDACMGPEGLTIGYEQSAAGLQNGSIAAIHTWASSGDLMNDPNTTDFADVIKFAPAASVEPGGKLAGSAWNDFWAIPASYKGDPELVFQMIMEAGRADHQVEAAQKGLVTRSSVLNSADALPFAPPSGETLTNGVGSVPKQEAYGLLDAALGNWLPLVGTGELSPEEALQKAEEEYIATAKEQGYLP